MSTSIEFTEELVEKLIPFIQDAIESGIKDYLEEKFSDTMNESDWDVEVARAEHLATVRAPRYEADLKLLLRFDIESEFENLTMEAKEAGYGEYLEEYDLVRTAEEAKEALLASVKALVRNYPGHSNRPLWDLLVEWVENGQLPYSLENEYPPRWAR